ncbi:hypothetical protein K1T71_009368 [Dendrolimus kikuchii]|uniref:Uncharacterized protein n=1 Tax=Dendrolimus kikuchii TaxID=765133 RepID=A0ACC1CVD6_9NEOP|nr:hypothetical protein K1T71_009368 [Dendrolimus kikuchii]
MSQSKLVKVDNWGIYFLQRLKNFFNRTDYCDLTLQFQDKAQLKVHRLVLSACTEYFEVLERTCEMYEDCLVMPDDLQADVVVPIINFMYTGQLEFSMDLLDRLYLTSQIMNMPILTKLLNSHRFSLQTKTPQRAYDYVPKKYSKCSEKSKMKKQVNTPMVPLNNKRSYTKAFSKSASIEDKIVYKPSRSDLVSNDIYFSTSSISPHISTPKKAAKYDPRPTRYELPEELDTDSEFDNSFSNISYASQPLMVHPETVKHHLKQNKSNEPTTSQRLRRDTSTLDIISCKKIPNNSIFEDNMSDTNNEAHIFPSSYMDAKEKSKDPSQLFDQFVEQNEGPKVTIETKNSKISSNLDHAKIISEVLKRYPHLMKTNKNIKLKILNTPTKVKKEIQPQFEDIPKIIKFKTEKGDEDCTYESDVIDSKQAANLISLGAENIKGPWICLICGTPGRALHFTTYYKFRCHLVNVHKEKPVSTICEYCGLKSLKRNYMMHHLYSQHGVQPPPQYNFPKCNQCNYIALTEGFLVKHKMSHSTPRRFRCNVCVKTYNTTQELLTHIQTTGHKYTPGKKANLQCVYCLKVFLRDYNLYTHLKSHHKQEAIDDEIIEDSDEEIKSKDKTPKIKYEEPVNIQAQYEDVEVQYEIQETRSGDIELVSRKQPPALKQKILNPGFTTQKSTPITVNHQQSSNVDNDEDESEEIVMIDNVEYVVKNDQLIPRKQKHVTKEDYMISDMLTSHSNQTLDSMIPTSSVKFANIQNSANIEDNSQLQKVTLNKQTTINHPIQIVVSNEEEYKDLVSANHPIIFENSDPNKTLTVLTTPNNAALSNTAINMNNTPSNDMMIISENYPLNVSASMAANNSNIVVVYSHPVDNQNKQYQLVTSGHGLGSQFVQSPAIITQNYQTVSNITAAMSTQVLDTSASWQNSVCENIIEQEHGPVIDVQTVEDSMDVKIKPINNDTEIHLVELPKVEFSQQTAQDMATPCNVGEEILADSNHTLNSNSAEVIETTEQDLINESNLTELQEPDHTVESEKNIETEHLNVIQTEQVTQNEHDSQTRDIITLHETNIESASNSEQIEHDVENILSVAEHDEHVNELTTEQSDVLVENEQPVPEVGPTQGVTYVPSTTYTQEERTNVDEKIITNSNSPGAQEIIEEIIPPVVNVTIDETTNKNVENLTSEWSEDEYDIVTEKEVDGTKLKDPTENNVGIVEMPVELEESIENIQQELNSTAASSTLEEIVENTNKQDENIISVVENIVSVDSNKLDINQDKPQNKISSLLNEWEDNDSQEENTSTVEVNENCDTAATNQQKATSPEKCTQADSKKNVKKNEQEAKVPDVTIKSLVSDWDDDDE